MSKVTFIQRDGAVRVGSADHGTVMELALATGAHGIEGQCGGVMSCGTCHVHVAPEWIDRVGTATDDEVDLLEFEDGFDPSSRLSCQIPLTADTDGLVVTIVRG